MTFLKCFIFSCFLTSIFCCFVIALKEDNVCRIDNGSKKEIFKRELDAIFAGHASEEQQKEDKQVIVVVMVGVANAAAAARCMQSA
jgi:hypothetical protein